VPTVDRAAYHREQGPARLLAAAKLTTRLRITGLRPDGYHLLDAEMVTVDLYDELEISDGEGLEVVDEVAWVGEGGGAGQGAVGGVVAAGGGGVAGRDLVEVALAAVRRSGRVRLTKRIPAGAGLGGGSADAAAVLRWAGCRDVGVASRVGADVPFCLGGGRAQVGGVGEVVSALPHVQGFYLLVVPRLHVSTPAVYAAWDALGGPVGDNGNDLEAAALAVQPRLAWWRELISDIASERPALAGSGGTWWIAGDRAPLADLAPAIEEAVGRAHESALVTVVATTAAS
jgi:4-diphosphocytidyl-2-C-methyl-D-erythritol kinase